MRWWTKGLQEGTVQAAAGGKQAPAMMSRGETTQSEDRRDCDISENLREGLLWLESKGKRITGEGSCGQITQT